MSGNLPVKKNQPIEVPELVQPANWSPDLTEKQKAHLQRFYESQKAAPLASLPMQCKWENCHCRHACPLFTMKVEPSPKGGACPIEVEMINRWLSEGMREMDISINDITDMAILREMVTWMVLEWRAQAELAASPETIRDSIVGVDPDTGDPIMKEFMNPIILMLEKAAKTKAKHRDALVSTREAKAKDPTRRQLSMSDLAITIQQKMEAKKKQLQELQHKPKELLEGSSG